MGLRNDMVTMTHGVLSRCWSFTGWKVSRVGECIRWGLVRDTTGPAHTLLKDLWRWYEYSHSGIFSGWHAFGAGVPVIQSGFWIQSLMRFVIFPSPFKDIMALAFSSDSWILAPSSTSQRFSFDVDLWDAMSGVLLWTFETWSSPEALKFPRTVDYSILSRPITKYGFLMWRARTGSMSLRTGWIYDGRNAIRLPIEHQPARRRLEGRCLRWDMNPGIVDYFFCLRSLLI